MRTPVKVALAAFTGLVVLGAAGVLWLLTPREQRRFPSTDGRYQIVLLSQPYQSLIPRMPGGGSDRPGWVELEDNNGRSFGRVPIAMLHMVHSLQFTEDGASIPAVGRWEFRARRVRYWNPDQTREIVESVSP